MEISSKIAVPLKSNMPQNWGEKKWVNLKRKNFHMLLETSLHSVLFSNKLEAKGLQKSISPQKKKNWNNQNPIFHFLSWNFFDMSRAQEIFNFNEIAKAVFV